MKTIMAPTDFQKTNEWSDKTFNEKKAIFTRFWWPHEFTERVYQKLLWILKDLISNSKRCVVIYPWFPAKLPDFNVELSVVARFNAWFVNPKSKS